MFYKLCLSKGFDHIEGLNLTRFSSFHWEQYNEHIPTDVSCRVGSVVSVSASRTVGREFASPPGHTKDHHKNGTNCLPA